MREYKVSLTWVLAIVAGSIFATSSLAAVTPLGEKMSALAVTIASDVVCSQCVGVNGDGTNDIKDGSVTGAKIASSAVTTAKLNGGSVTNAKLADSAVTTSKIADGTISAADLGPDSVGASELKGVTKLNYFTCTFSQSTPIAVGSVDDLSCGAPGTTSSDSVLVSINTNNYCFTINDAMPNTDSVNVFAQNTCPSPQPLGTGSFALMVYHK